MIGKYSKPGDVVADLMAGTGSVLGVAKRMGRETIYNDISKDQLKLAKIVIDNEQESEMDLRRKEVIDLMTKEVQEMNKKLMYNLDIPHEQQEQYMKESTNELNRVNGILFDMLVKNGVIR